MKHTWRLSRVEEDIDREKGKAGLDEQANQATDVAKLINDKNELQEAGIAAAAFGTPESDAAPDIVGFDTNKLMALTSFAPAAGGGFGVTVAAPGTVGLCAAF